MDDQLKIERFLTKDILHQDITNRKKGSKGNSKQGGVTRGRKIHSKKATSVVQGKLLKVTANLLEQGCSADFRS